MESEPWLVGLNGASSHILSKYSKALYTHCAAHRLNLCVVKCCSLRVVSSMMEVANKTAPFSSNSPKRQLSLEISIELREAYEVFIDLLLPIMKIFHVVIDVTESHDLMHSLFF